MILKQARNHGSRGREVAEDQFLPYLTSENAPLDQKRQEDQLQVHGSHTLDHPNVFLYVLVYYFILFLYTIGLVL